MALHRLLCWLGLHFWTAAFTSAELLPGKGGYVLTHKHPERLCVCCGVVGRG